MLTDGCGCISRSRPEDDGNDSDYLSDDDAAEDEEKQQKRGKRKENKNTQGQGGKAKQPESNVSETTNKSAARKIFPVYKKRSTVSQGEARLEKTRWNIPLGKRGRKGARAVNRSICIATINVRGMGRQQQ